MSQKSIQFGIPSLEIQIEVINMGGGPKMGKGLGTIFRTGRGAL